MNKINEIIYQFWTGDNSLTKNRTEALETNINLNVNVKTLMKSDIEKMILPEHPLHPGYEFLSKNHQSDYLRSYFMNFYGGGYADIKYFSKDNNWKECFDLINENDEIDVIGQHEVPNGSHITNLNTKNMLNIVLSNGWFICRPHSKFTEEWYKRVQIKMDQRYNILKRHPATEVFGTNEGYPMRWGEMQCEIFHPMCQETWQDNKNRIKNILNPGVIWKAYR